MIKMITISIKIQKKHFWSKVEKRDIVLFSERMALNAMVGRIVTNGTYTIGNIPYNQTKKEFERILLKNLRYSFGSSVKYKIREVS